MFIEDNENIEQAANVDDNMQDDVQDNVQDNAEKSQPTSPVEQVDQTKAFAARLKEEKAKAKLEAREEIAKSFGYANWNEYSEAQTNSKLMDNGLDPDMVRPVLKDLIHNDPEYLEAMKFKAEKEELEKELFASNSIKELNEKFGTNYKSVNELDSETVRMWNAGTPLEKAYAANNWETIRDNAIKSIPKDNGKAHLKTITGSNEPVQGPKPITDEELRVFKMFGFDKEKVEAYRNKH